MDFAIPDNLEIVLILTMGFTFASFFGVIAQKLHFTPLVGYLIAGWLIGPYSPGYVADFHTANELAEIGIILMMFGVGLHFKWQDLAEVKWVAIPGAILQTVLCALLSTFIFSLFGWPLAFGLIMGLVIGVASTIVLVRLFSEERLLHTQEGHLAVGWLIVEDLLSVMLLFFIPLMQKAQASELLSSFTWITLKVLLLMSLVVTLIQWLVTKLLKILNQETMEELFTITMLALIFLMAVGSTLLFGLSIALGAFIAGMVIGQSVAKHHALKSAIPLKNTFTVIFFLSVGMLFKPSVIWEHFTLFSLTLSLILVVKPLLAFLLTLLFRYPLKTALLMAIALGQIGELSFILAELAEDYNILPQEAFETVVACSIISIALNPFLFKLLMPYLRYVKARL